MSFILYLCVPAFLDSIVRRHYEPTRVGLQSETKMKALTEELTTLRLICHTTNSEVRRHPLHRLLKRYMLRHICIKSFRCLFNSTTLCHLPSQNLPAVNRIQYRNPPETLVVTVLEHGEDTSTDISQYFYAALEHYRQLLMTQLEEYLCYRNYQHLSHHPVPACNHGCEGDGLFEDTNFHGHDRECAVSAYCLPPELIHANFAEFYVNSLDFSELMNACWKATVSDEVCHANCPHQDDHAWSMNTLKSDIEKTLLSVDQLEKSRYGFDQSLLFSDSGKISPHNSGYLRWRATVCVCSMNSNDFAQGPQLFFISPSWDDEDRRRWIFVGDAGDFYHIAKRECEPDVSLSRHTLCRDDVDPVNFRHVCASYIKWFEIWLDS